MRYGGMNPTVDLTRRAGGRYRAFGLTIDSTLALPELPAADAGRAAEVEVTEGAVPAELAGARRRLAYFQAAPGKLLMSVPGVARYLAIDGRRVTIERESGIADDEVRAFLLTVAMGGVLHQRDDLVLHGSAVAIGGEAVAFLGRSGVGKSTLAAAFRRRGHPVLTDDLCVVRPREDGRMMVHPGFPHMKLALDALEKLELPADGLRRIRHKDGKRALPLGREFASAALPLKKLYHLGRSPTERLTFTPRSGPEVIVALRNLTYRFGLLWGLAKQPRHFAQVLELARQVPLTIVARPTKCFEVDELVVRIEEDLRAAAR